MVPGDSDKKKLFLSYLQRAEEIQEADEKVAYYVRVYALDKALKDRAEGCRETMCSVMESMDKQKPHLSLNPVLDAAHCRAFALRVFNIADMTDRAGRPDRTTAKGYFASHIFIEILKQFGELDAEVRIKQKYALYRASEIRKAVREQRAPVPPPTGDALEDELNELMEVDASGNIPRAFKDIGSLNSTAFAALAVPQPDHPTHDHADQASERDPIQPTYAAQVDDHAGSLSSRESSSPRAAAPKAPGGPPDGYTNCMALSSEAEESIAPSALPQGPTGQPQSPNPAAITMMSPWAQMPFSMDLQDSALPSAKQRFWPGSAVLLCESPEQGAPIREGTVIVVSSASASGYRYWVGLDDGQEVELEGSKLAPAHGPCINLTPGAYGVSAEVTHINKEVWPPSYVIRYPNGTEALLEAHLLGFKEPERGSEEVVVLDHSTPMLSATSGAPAGEASHVADDPPQPGPPGLAAPLDPGFLHEAEGQATQPAPYSEYPAPAPAPLGPAPTWEESPAPEPARSAPSNETFSASSPLTSWVPPPGHVRVTQSTTGFPAIFSGAPPPTLARSEQEHHVAHPAPPQPPQSPPSSFTPPSPAAASNSTGSESSAPQQLAPRAGSLQPPTATPAHSAHSAHPAHSYAAPRSDFSIPHPHSPQAPHPAPAGSHQHQPIPDSRPAPPHGGAPPPAGPVIGIPPGHRPSVQSIMTAQKNAKYAVSSLNFEDVHSAVKQLTDALKALGAMR